MNEQKEKFGWKRLIIIITIVAVTSLAIGGTVWYFMDKNLKKVEATNSKTISDLRKQIDDLTLDNGIVKVTESTGSGLTSEGPTMSGIKAYSIDSKKGEQITTSSEFGYVFSIEGVDKEYITIASNKRFAFYNEVQAQQSSFKLDKNGTEVKIHSGTMDGNARYTFTFIK